MKGAGLVYRALQLAPTVLREKPTLAISHGARSQLLVSNWLRIPTVLMEDYEYCEFPPMMRPSWVLMPEVIPDSSLEMPKTDTEIRGNKGRRLRLETAPRFFCPKGAWLKAIGSHCNGSASSHRSPLSQSGE